MCLQPNEEISMEVYETTDQFFRFEEGRGKVIINGEEHIVKDGTIHKTKSESETDTEDHL
jgi:mannose-6-phosphate isomerase-like protein (cupin superfamily)